MPLSGRSSRHIAEAILLVVLGALLLGGGVFVLCRYWHHRFVSLFVQFGSIGVFSGVAAIVEGLWLLMRKRGGNEEK